MKKLTSLLLAIILVFSFVVPASAASNETEKAGIAPYFSEAEAADIALLFVLNNAGKGDNNWSSDTFINEVYVLYDFNNNVTGYTFKLCTNGNYSGYICVSANQDVMPIQEFSFTDLPVFEEKLSADVLAEIEKNDFKNEKASRTTTDRIVYNGNLEYFVNDSGSYFDMDRKIVTPPQTREVRQVNAEAVAHNSKLKEIIADSQRGNNYSGQLNGYVISDRFTYMKDRYGSYSYEGGSSLSGFTGLDMDDYGGSNDCSLVSITAVAKYYRSTYPNIPSSTSDIYDDVLAVGKEHGYTTSGGTNPTVIDNIIEDSFKKWGYTVSASNTYVWSFSTFTNQIDSPNSNPVLFNIATGYYADHTITVIGYVEYDVADFLMVKDNWSTSTRYVHWQQMWNEIGSVTTVNG